MTVLWIVTRSDKPPAPLYSEVRFGLPEAALAVQYVREYSEALDEDDEREQEDARVQAVLYADHAVLPLMEAGLHPFFQTYYAHLVDVAAPGAQPDVLATIKVSLPDVARLNKATAKADGGRGKGPRGKFPDEKGVWKSGWGDAPPWGWGKVLRTQRVSLGGFAVERTQAFDPDKAPAPASSDDEVRENPPPPFGPGDRVRKPAGVVEAVWYSGIPGEDWLARVLTARGPVTVPVYEVRP